MGCNKKYRLSLGGYFTIEGSLIIPLVIFLYIALIFAAFMLYDKCLTAQDCYLLSFRGSVFGYAGEGYGEIIYGCLGDRSSRDIENYITDRRKRLKGKYPAFQITEESIEITGSSVSVSVRGNIHPSIHSWEINTRMEAQIINPVAIIRGIRKEMRSID